MPKGLSASLPDLDSECWIEVKKRPRPSPARPKLSAEKVKFRATHPYSGHLNCLDKINNLNILMALK